MIYLLLMLLWIACFVFVYKKNKEICKELYGEETISLFEMIILILFAPVIVLFYIEI